MLEPKDGENLHQGAYELSLDARNPVLYTPVIRSNQSIDADEFQDGNVRVVELGTRKAITSDVLPAFAEYRVEREGKRHDVRIRYAASDSRPVSVRINGELVFDAACLLPTGGVDADSLRWHDIGIYELAEGENVVRLESDGPFPLINAINLRPLSQ